MSLLVGNVLSPSQSVAQVIALKASLNKLLRQLSGVLVGVVIGALCVIVLTFGVFTIRIPAISAPAYVQSILVFLEHLPERFLSAATLLALFVAVDRMRVVKQAFKTVLEARFRLVIEESRRSTLSRAPTKDDVARVFRTPSGFGAPVPFGRADEDENR